MNTQSLLVIYASGWRSGKQLPQVTLSSRTGPAVTRSLLNEADVVRTILVPVSRFCTHFCALAVFCSVSYANNPVH